MVLEMLTGGGLVALGVLIGRLLPARRRSPKPPTPVCGCRHQLAYHDPASGRCNERVLVEGVWDEKTRRHVDKLVACDCRQYTGPTPLPTVYAPEVTS